MSGGHPSPVSGVRDPRRIARYLVAGLTAATTHLWTVTALVELAGLRPVAATTIGFGAGLVVSYTLQRTWVFAHPGRHRQLVPRFLAVIAVALALNTGVVHVGTATLGFHYVPVQLVALALIPVSNYLLNSWWTFR